VKIVVVGDSCTDKYVYGNCNRLSPEGPVPVLNVSKEVETDGMAANTFNNILSLCNNSSDVKIISNPITETMSKTRFVDDRTNQLLLRVDHKDSCERIDSHSMNKLLEFSKNGYSVIVSDYDKGFLSLEDIIEIGKMFEFSVLDTKKKLHQEVIDFYNFIKLNETEYNNNSDIIEKRFSNSTKILITLGSKGVKFINRIKPPKNVHQTFDVSGAGDTFVAAFTYNMLNNLSIADSISKAQDCCSQVIQKRGTASYTYE